MPDFSNSLNREEWLTTATTMLRTHFRTAGYEIPRNVRVSCGFPSRSATSRKSRRIGECWDANVSDGQVFEVFISPVIADGAEVAAVLAHELVHATVGLQAKHNKPFKKCALAIGLTGKMASTTAGEAFTAWYESRKDDLGPYPHERLNASSAPKKQTTRMIKVACPMCEAAGEPYIVRMSAATFEKGAPICPIHGEPLEEA